MNIANNERIAIIIHLHLKLMNIIGYLCPTMIRNEPEVDRIKVYFNYL